MRISMAAAAMSTSTRTAWPAQQQLQSQQWRLRCSTQAEQEQRLAQIRSCLRSGPLLRSLLNDRERVRMSPTTRTARSQQY